MATLTNELTSGYDRVRAHTAPHVNQRIENTTRGSVERYRGAEPERILARLSELEREWDIDRALMATFAVLGGTTFNLGRFVHRRWFDLFQVQLGFLFLHAVVGWCPPTSVLRRMGYRTHSEIEAEKTALRELLGSSRSGAARA